MRRMMTGIEKGLDLGVYNAENQKFVSKLRDNFSGPKYSSDAAEFSQNQSIANSISRLRGTGNGATFISRQTLTEAEDSLKK